MDLVMDWPKGDDSNDTILAGNHFNLTALKLFNYTLYQNETVSNNSKCYLLKEPYQPVSIFANGTFVNATSCYKAVKSIGTRGHTGIGLAVAYGIALVLTVTVLAKHGKLYLPRETRFYPIGRRWQWYWASFVCATALVSLFTNVDVDRYYLQELPITLTVFFWFLVCQGTMAVVWEAVRHWGSWQERQFIDPNPFILAQDDRRSKIEFWLPMWFYLWVWLNFFLVVPRSWKFSQMQRSEEQALAIAAPTATGVRFKAGAFCLFVAWLTICASLLHSIKHYRTRSGSILDLTVGWTRHIPLRFYLIIPLALSTVAYQACIAWVWDFSVIKYNGNIPVIYGWGYGPPLAIILIQIIYGWASPNEDKELIRQRRERGERIDAELGIVRKPAWWRRVRGDHLGTLRDKIARNVDEIGGGRATGRRVEAAAERHAREEAEGMADRNDGYELQSMHRDNSASNPRADRAGVHSQGFSQTRPEIQHQPYTGKSERRRAERHMEIAAGILFPNSGAEERARREADLGLDGPPPPYSDQETRGRSRATSGSAGRSNSAESSNSINQPPQQVRSMLDI